jgi:hypothetical protein
MVLESRRECHPAGYPPWNSARHQLPHEEFVPEHRKKAEKTRKTSQSFDGLVDAIYVFVVSGRRMLVRNRESQVPHGAEQSDDISLFILDNAKPVARRGRKAMGPSRVAWLPKGWGLRKPMTALGFIPEALLSW